MIGQKTIFENVVYGSDPCQKFDIIIPADIKNPVNAIVYIHGGAYLYGNKSQYPYFLTEYKNNILASIGYRLINDNNNIFINDILYDINSALLKIKELSESVSAGIKEFILIGHSAGAHIALLFGYKYYIEKIKIAACISLAGPTDYNDDLGWSSMSAWGADIKVRLSFLSNLGSRLTGQKIELTQSDWTNQRNFSMFKEYVAEISPIDYISKNKQIPPTLLVHAKSDNQVPYSNAIRLNNALDNTSVPHKLITPESNGDNHLLGGEVLSNKSPIFFRNQKWVNEAMAWMKEYL